MLSRVTRFVTRPRIFIKSELITYDQFQSMVNHDFKTEENEKNGGSFKTLPQLNHEF